MTSDEEDLYGVEELAERAGVSRRTVRYYVQRGLLPAPRGLGRGKHYTQAHLAALVRIRELQEAAVPLEEIAERLSGREPEAVSAPAVSQTTWTRVVLSADVEIHVRGRRLSEDQVRKLSRVVNKSIGDIS